MPDDIKIKRWAAKLLACIGIFAVAFTIKVAFPQAAADAQESMAKILGGNVDYKAAIVTLGEGIGGEKEFTQALAEACAYAFAIGEEIPENVEAGVQKTAEPPSEKALEFIVPLKLESGGAIAVPQKTEENAQQETTENEPANDVVSAYIESLGEYADEELPDGVTYEMPEINFEYTTPTSGTVTSKFGYRMHPIENVLKFHYGTDIGAPEGTEIVAFADGTVLAAGESTSLGNYIILQHADGVKTQYAHCSELFVSSGDSVTKGQKIAAVGATGEATGNNLHFELTVNEVYVNPEYYVSW